MNIMAQDGEEKLIGDRIIAVIRSGKAKMRPRWYFILQSALITTAVVIVFIILVYIVSFSFFVLHQNGAWFVPVFGFAGWFAFLNSLPWILVLLSIVFILLLFLLIRRYHFGYHWPLVYSLLAILFVIIGGCLLVIQTSLYEQIFDPEVPQQFPLIGAYDPLMNISSDNIRRGKIIGITSDGFVLRDIYGRLLPIVVTPHTTNFPFGANFKMGDIVVVFGEWSASGTIQAVGVEKLVP